MDLTVIDFTRLLITACFITGLVIVAFIFIFRIKRAKGSGIDQSPFLGLSLFLLFFGITHIFFFYWWYFKAEFGISFISDIFYKGAVLSGYCGLIGVSFFSEKMLKKTKFLFTGFTIAFTIIAAFFLYTESDLRNLTYITMPLSISIVIINFIYQMVIKTRGEIRRKMVGAFLCILGFFFFYMMGTELGKTIFPFHESIEALISDAGSLGTLIIWGYIFLSFETFTELEWQEKLKEIYIIAPNGATLVYYSFFKSSHSPKTDLISSGLTGVRGILAEMVQSKKNLKVVDHQDVKIIFEHGNYSTVALIAYENLQIYHSKLFKLSNQFENLFQDILSKWHGEIEVFLPATRLIEDTFAIK